MRKKALLALMLVLTLLLSGCTLIVKDQAVDNATEIIRMGDRVVTKKEVKEQVDSVLQYNEYMYSMMGQSYDVTDPQVIASAQEEAIDDLKKDLTLTAKAKELGLDQLTAEEEETVKTKAQEDYSWTRRSPIIWLQEKLRWTRIPNPSGRPSLTTKSASTRSRTLP